MRQLATSAILPGDRRGDEADGSRPREGAPAFVAPGQPVRSDLARAMRARLPGSRCEAGANGALPRGRRAGATDRSRRRVLMEPQLRGLVRRFAAMNGTVPVTISNSTTPSAVDDPWRGVIGAVRDLFRRHVGGRADRLAGR